MRKYRRPKVEIQESGLIKIVKGSTAEIPESMVTNKLIALSEEGDKNEDNRPMLLINRYKNPK